MKKAIILATAILLGSTPLALAQKSKGVSATTPGAEMKTTQPGAKGFEPGPGASGYTPADKMKDNPMTSNGASSYAPGMANKKK